MTQETLSPDKGLYSLRGGLTAAYDEIESRAKSVIQQGQAVDNPLLTKEKQETRYAIATCGLLNGPADVFLERVAHGVDHLERDNFRPLPSGFRHIALREVTFGERGRKALGIDAEAAKNYYHALQVGFQQKGKPIQLELVKVIPTIDREQNSVSIVGAFLPVEDTNIVTIRERINEAIQKSGLPFHGRLGDIPVLFSTVGRLIHPPKQDGETVPLLDVLDRLNAELSNTCITTIEEIDVVSTTPTSYVWTDKSVFMYPPISITKPNRYTESHFITAAHRKILREIDQ